MFDASTSQAFAAQAAKAAALVPLASFLKWFQFGI